MSEPITYKKFTVSDLNDSISDGWTMFKAIPGVSIGFTSIFAVIGLVLLVSIGFLGASPMAFPLAGGFMLVGPILLSGFFKIADLYNNKEPVRFIDTLIAIKNAPAQLWVIALICAMLFLVWITDAAILYAIMVGDEKMPYTIPWVIEFRSDVIAFELWGSVMGSIVAFLIFSVSAFSVPLLYQGRTNLVNAVTLSVKTVLGNFVSSLIWGVTLSVLMIFSILLLPLFTVTLPVLAFASYSLYKKVFPQPTSIAEE